MFDYALLRHQAGQPAEAEQLIRKILEIDPHHADSLHYLGALAHLSGRHETAADLIVQAIQLNGEVPIFHYNLGRVLSNQGKFDAAERCYKQALAINHNFAEAYSNLGALLIEQGKLDEAVTCCERALSINPNLSEPYNNLGSIFFAQGKLDEAAEYCRRALAFRPEYVVAYFNLGRILQAQGQLDEAAACFRRAIAINPHYAEAYNNLGGIFLTQDNPDEALTCYQRALAINPDNAEAHSNLGNVFFKQGKLDEAIACCERAITINPHYAEAHYNLGLVFKNQGRLDDAMASYRRALALKPESADTYVNLLLAMVYAASVSPEELTMTAREFGERITDPLRRQRSFVRSRDPKRKLRIGYVSPDLRDHAATYFFEPLLKMHDRQKFDIFAYSNVRSEDALTKRLRRKFDYWRDIRPLSDDEAADIIEADAIDILVDLAGHTGENRLGVFARKPAPVQVTWLGYPGTTGMAAMDYRITDSYAEPPGMTEHLNVETLWRLPEIFCCYQARENSPAVIDHPPFEDNGYITFGCFNNFVKVSDPVLETWSRILAQVPDSRLFLEIAYLKAPQFRASVEERMKHFGLPLDRLILQPRKKSNQFVLYNRIDIALDPFPCTGGTTSFDTMWMGVPFITLAGESFASRMGVTILTNAGLSELIAEDADQYVVLAARLANDKERLLRLRHNLRQKVAASPLMNHEAFARNMETAYREMWQKWSTDAVTEKD